MVDKPEMVFAGGRKMDCILIAGDGHQSTYNNGIYIYIHTHYVWTPIMGPCFACSTYDDRWYNNDEWMVNEP